MNIRGALFAAVPPATSSKASSFSRILYQRGNEEEKRDYIYYLALGHIKLKDYQKAKKFVDAILTKEPNNKQALELKALVEKKLVKDGLFGIALVGGGAIVFGTLVFGVGAVAVGAIAAAKMTWRK